MTECFARENCRDSEQDTTGNTTDYDTEGDIADITEVCLQLGLWASRGFRRTEIYCAQGAQGVQR